MWPWLLMPLAALTLYLALHSVRESAPQNHPDSPSQAAPAEVTDSGSEP
jgi:hypothetical protein